MIQKAVMVCLAAALFVCSCHPFAAAAEEPNVMDWLNEEESGEQPAETAPDTNAGTDNAGPNNAIDKSPILLISQLLFYTLLIVAMIYGLIKFLASRQKKLQPNQAIDLIGGAALGTNKSLQLVKVGGKVFLLGVADQITLIKEFSGEDELGTFENNPKETASFANSLLGLTKKHSQSGQFDQLFKQSLNKQRNRQNQLEQDLVPNDKEGRNT
ncbi:flagellar biosynthetic protein FliO [Mesobacillus campisalis]|nr:flagellar biosynthetic protein FliO [Mesobacillus campisalis]